MNGLLGYLSQMDTSQLNKDYSGCPMDSETITLGIKLIRNVVLFTDKRVLIFDKQGTTGSKTRVISITDISSPNLKSNNIQLLYKMLQEILYEIFTSIKGLRQSQSGH